jgi:hypothetical protein
MKPNRYKVAATLLGGKYKMGIVGKTRPRVVGRIGHVEYTLTSTWDMETHTETYGVIRKKKRKSYDTTHGHVFHLRSPWLSQPCTIRRSGGKVRAVSAVPGDTISLTEEQQELLNSAFSKWPGIEITNHGIEWEVDEKEQTAQEFALNIEGLAGVLELLPTERDSVVARITSKASIPSMTELTSMLKKPLGLGKEDRIEEDESQEALPDLSPREPGESAPD